MSDPSRPLQLELFGEAPAASPAPAAEPPPGAPLVTLDGAPLTPEEKVARLAEVREPALGCCHCGLSRDRTHVVFGEGNPAAPLLLIGEGPGETEDATGRPFVGRAGKLLDEALRENGMHRERHVYICNVVKCRAADYDGTRWVNRPPAPEEIPAGCR